MPHPSTRRSPAPATAARAVVAVALVALAVVGCGAGASPVPSTGAPATPLPTSSAAAPTPPAPTKVPGSGERTPPPSPGTLDTAWGEAWDTLPPGFPLPPRATPAEPGDPADGPVSGAFVVALAAADAAEAQQLALAAAGYSTEALSGPSEDGALVIDFDRPGSRMPRPDDRAAAGRDDDAHDPLRGRLPLGLTERRPATAGDAARTGGTTMGPTPRDWLGAGILALALLVMIVLLVATAAGAGAAGEAAVLAVG